MMDEKEATLENIEEPQKEAILENIEEPQATSFDAEKIVSSAVDENGKRFYQVRWVTYSWEPEASFLKAEHMVKKFWEEYEEMRKKNKEKVANDQETSDLEQQQQQQQEQKQQQQQQKQQQQRQKKQQLSQRQQQSQLPRLHQNDAKKQDGMPLLPIKGVKFKSAKTEELVQAIEQTIKNVVTSFKENQTSALAALLPTMVNQENMNNVSTSDNEETPPDEEIDFQAGPMPSVDSQSGDAPTLDAGQASVSTEMIKVNGDAIVVETRAEALKIMREKMKPARFCFKQGFCYPEGIPPLSYAAKKILWWTESIAYTGIPFIALGGSYYRCGHGGGKLWEKKKRIHHFPCPATVRLREYVFFPSAQISSDVSDYMRKRAAKRVHNMMESGDTAGALKRIIMTIPSPSDHNHDMEQPFTARCTYAHTRNPAHKGLPGHTYTAFCRVCYETRKAPGYKRKKSKKKKKEKEAL